MAVTVESGWAVVFKGLHTLGDGQLLLTSGELSRIAYDYGGRCDDIAMPPPPEDGLWVWEGEVVDGLPGNADWQYQGGYRRAGPADLGAFWPEWWAEEKEGETLRSAQTAGDDTPPDAGPEGDEHG